ncbi:MAG: metallophosphoesterase [Deltaproteobacteria bacterium]|nr:metallophosphoesterase [Deltaproteobacteria bacterium]
MNFFFASDLHGRRNRYDALCAAIRAEQPNVVLLGGDLFAGAFGGAFINDDLRPRLTSLAADLGPNYPRVLLIFGNDDPRSMLPAIEPLQALGLCEHIHDQVVQLDDTTLCGYAFTPPSPFQLKDWERYDVSRYVDPGCVAPQDGRHSVTRPAADLAFGTIAADLQGLRARLGRMERAIMLFHGPPYKGNLDRAALDGKMVDHVPLDVHVGSIAIARFIEEHQPLLTLHGHIHESVRLTGSWQERRGGTFCFGGAHDGPELALVRFDSANLDAATRELIAP